MPRHPRVHAPGLLFHVMVRGNNGQKVFLGPADYEAFVLEKLTRIGGIEKVKTIFVLSSSKLETAIPVKEGKKHETDANI